jgi:hypothetical protein
MEQLIIACLVYTHNYRRLARHDVRDHRSPVFGFLPSCMPSSKVFDGWSNDCQRMLSCTTRLPDSRSWITTAEAEEPVVSKYDHVVWPESSRSRRFPASPITSTPEPRSAVERGVTVGHPASRQHPNKTRWTRSQGIYLFALLWSGRRRLE